MTVTGSLLPQQTVSAPLSATAGDDDTPYSEQTIVPYYSHHPW